MLLVYDTSSRSEFINIRNWYSYVSHKGVPHLQVYLASQNFALKL